VLRIDPDNPRAVELGDRLAALLAGSRLPPGLCITVGGDGWLLSTLHEEGGDRVLLGVNAGHLGFLLNDVGPNGRGVDALAADIIAGRFTVHRFPALTLQAWPADGGAPTSSRALNDVFVERTTGRTAWLRVLVDGTVVVDQLACDGLIVATALGSTAYSFSAGGVPSHPLAEALHVTPICAHAPRLSPFILPLSAAVDIEVLRQGARPVRASADGIGGGLVRRVRVVAAPEGVRLAFLAGHDFTATLVRKILKA